MKSITIIGTGNVATHLCIALAGTVEELINIPSRSLEDLPTDSDLYILSVSDDAIETVASQLPPLKGILTHTSGSKPMDILAPYAERYGVFYPLQTFTKGSDLNYSEIPVFIEGSSPEVAATLSGVAAFFTSRIYPADSARRKVLHVASVFACNYVNHLWSIADRILRDNGMGLDVLYPLMNATLEKAMRIPPHEGQTGPAIRDDKQVLLSHLQMLGASADADIYRLLGNSILKEYNHETLPEL